MLSLPRGKGISWSNAHYGNPMQLLQKERSLGMWDGWETARNPNRPSEYLVDASGSLIIPGNEWAIIQLGTSGTVERIVVGS
jgi:allantoicase